MNKNHLGELVDYFLFYLDIDRGFSENTKVSYKNDLMKFVAFLENKGLNDFKVVDLQIIQDFLKDLHHSKLSTATIARLLSTLKHFFRFMILQRVISKNPLDYVDTPKIQRNLPDFLTVEEVENFLNAVDVSSPVGVRDRAIVEVLYGCGLRVSELINLKIRDILLDFEVIKIYGKGKKERIVPIGKSALFWINEYINRSRFIFIKDKPTPDVLFLNQKGKKFSRMGIWKILHKYAVKIGLENKVHPHIFRHSFATHMINAGANIRIVQEMLGHSDISTTQIYTHISKEVLQEVYRSYHPRG